MNLRVVGLGDEGEDEMKRVREVERKVRETEGI